MNRTRNEKISIKQSWIIVALQTTFIIIAKPKQIYFKQSLWEKCYTNKHLPLSAWVQMCAVCACFACMALIALCKLLWNTSCSTFQMIKKLLIRKYVCYIEVCYILYIRFSEKHAGLFFTQSYFMASEDMKYGEFLLYF